MPGFPVRPERPTPLQRRATPPKEPGPESHESGTGGATAAPAGGDTSPRPERVARTDFSQTLSPETAENRPQGGDDVPAGAPPREANGEEPRSPRRRRGRRGGRRGRGRGEGGTITPNVSGTSDPVADNGADDGEDEGDDA
jgi:hypothetical protein